jgi:hypothetical protein
MKNGYFQRMIFSENGSILAVSVILTKELKTLLHIKPAVYRQKTLFLPLFDRKSFIYYIGGAVARSPRGKPRGKSVK